MPTELKSSEIESAEALPQQHAADFAADVSLVLDALGRMEATARADRTALERLRGGLAAMAASIGRAKAEFAAGGTDTPALLDELEHRADSMIEIVGGSVTGGAAGAESADVPTVSWVVAQHGPAPALEQDDAAPPVNDAAADAAHEAAEAAHEA